MTIIVKPKPTVAPASAGNNYLRSSLTPEQAGAGVGQAQRGAGQDILRAADEMTRTMVAEQGIRNETAVNDTYATEFSPKLREIYQGYYATQGKDAVDQRPAFEGALQKLRQETRDKLTNPEQQRMFDLVSKRRLDSELEGMGRHALVQDEIWQGQTSDATLKTLLNDAADKHNDEQAFGTAIGSGLAEIDRFATRPGKTQSAEVIKARADGFVSKAWTARIQSAVLHEPLAAEKLYQDNQKEIAADERAALEHQIKSAVLPVKAKTDAADIIRRDLPKDGRPMTATQIRAHQGDWMAQAEKLAEKKYPDDPVYRDLVVGQLSTYITRITAAEEAISRNARNSVLAAAITPDAGGQKVADINALLTKPAMKDAWSRLEADQQIGILHVLKQNASPDQTPESLAKYHEMRGLAVNDPAAYSERLKTDFLPLSKLLPNEQMLQLINQDTAIAKGDVKLAAQSAYAGRIHRVTDGLLVQAGFKIPKKDEKKQEVLDAYQNYTSRMLDVTQQFVETHKRKPTDVELRDLAKQQLVQGYEAGSGWWGYGKTKIPAFAATENFAVPAPPAEVPRIRAAYKKTFGKEPSAEEIDKWYAAGLLQRKK